MKLIKDDKHSEVYDDGNKIIKKYKPGETRQLKNSDWLIYFDDFNSKYDMFPKIYDVYDEGELFVCEMEKIEGDTLQNNLYHELKVNRPRGISYDKEEGVVRSKVMEWIKQTHDLVGCFLEYNIEISRDRKLFIHEDINMNNILVDSSSGKLKLIDLDSLRIYPVRKYSPFMYYSRWLSEFHNHTIHLE